MSAPNRWRIARIAAGTLFATLTILCCGGEPPKPAPAATSAPAPPPKVRVYVTNESSGDLTVINAETQTASCGLCRR